MTKLLKKGRLIEWTDDCERCFREIKKWLISALVLTLPKVGEPFIVYTYVSGDDRVIAYISRQLRPHEKITLPMT